MKQVFECTECGKIQYFLNGNSSQMTGWIANLCGSCEKKIDYELRKVKRPFEKTEKPVAKMVLNNSRSEA